LFSSELEQERRCSELREKQAKNRFAGKSVANIFGLTDENANAKFDGDRSNDARSLSALTQAVGLPFAPC
jgi:ribosomal protein L25 (general stress protein Ctc)